jgi:cell wall-associated NlpC family hydrolase
MLRGIACLIIMTAPALASAANVTTPEARKLTLLEYVAARDDLDAAEKKEWDKVLRSTFGGAAMKDGTDEGVTVAKSVIAAAVFFDVEPKKAARAAWDAYHDTYRWVPPPIAINYQILVMQGRKPKAEARQLAFDFPRYFNEEIAPDLAVWWDEMLAAGKIQEFERKDVEEALKKTRALMRPMLRGRLWQAVELDARLQWLQRAGTKGPQLTEVQRGLAALVQELHHDFKAVGNDPRIADEKTSYYDRYAALSGELRETPKPRPAYPGPVPPPKAEPQPESKRPPVPAAPKPGPAPTPGPTVTDGQTPPPPKLQPPEAVIAEAKDAEADERKAQKNAGRQDAPLSGDPLVPPFQGWQNVLNATVDRWLGTPYLWGGVDHRGIDCSGFARQVFRETFNIELPRNSRAQFSTGVKVDQKDLDAGDLLFFDTMDRGTVTHVGVYLGSGVFAHSASKGVSRTELAKKYHQRAFYGSRRLLKK